jgi:glycosyltransferase 2 family protein
MPRPSSRHDPDEASGRSTRRWRASQLARVLVTLGLVGLVLWRVEVGQLRTVASGAQAGWLGLALLAYSLMLITSTWKWSLLLRAVGVVRNFWSLFRFYTIGFFFSSILPGSVGGDLVRWHATSETPEMRLHVAATIVAERITGVATLVVLCCVLVARDRARLATPPTLILLGGASLGLCAGLWLAWNTRLAKRLLGRAHGRGGVILGALHKLHRTLNDIPGAALRAAVWNSLLFYASAGLLFYLVGRSVGAPISYLEATSVQILISLVTLVPISLGGLGLAQVGDVYLLGLLSVDAPTALAMSLLRQLGRYFYAGLGAVFFLRWPGHPKVSELQALAGAPPEPLADAARGGR